MLNFDPYGLSKEVDERTAAVMAGGSRCRWPRCGSTGCLARPAAAGIARQPGTAGAVAPTSCAHLGVRRSRDAASGLPLGDRKRGGRRTGSCLNIVAADAWRDARSPICWPSTPRSRGWTRSGRPAAGVASNGPSRCSAGCRNTPGATRPEAEARLGGQKDATTRSNCPSCRPRSPVRVEAPTEEADHEHLPTADPPRRGARG